MATFTAASAAIRVNMYDLLGFAPGNDYRNHIINDIEVSNDSMLATVTSTGTGPLGENVEIRYAGVGPFEDEGFEEPTAGIFDEVSIYIGGTHTGTLDITGDPRSGFFAEINTNNAYYILFYNDDITGSDEDDALFTGDGGNDNVWGGAGGDEIFVAAVNGAPLHFIDGGDDGDTLVAVANHLSNASVLDLRQSTVQDIEALAIESGVTMRLNSSQLNATNVSLSSFIFFAGAGSGAGPGDPTLHITKNQAGTLDLSGFGLDDEIRVIVDGTSGTDFILGSNAPDTIRGDAGIDTVSGGNSADRFLVAAAASEFDTVNGGNGADTLGVEGGGPLTLNGFNAASQSIEVWAGNGQSLIGNGGANIFDLAGLTSMTGLPFVEGLGGNDTLTGSNFVDRLLGGDGNDAMSAGAGDDELEGGLGVDTMTGGLGGDRFDFDAVAEIGKKKGLLDLIADWGDGDTIDLSSIDANGSKKGDKPFKFLKKEGAALTKAGQLGFDQKKGATYVQGDLNGDGKADFKLQVTGAIDFVKADFVL